MCRCSGCGCQKPKEVFAKPQGGFFKTCDACRKRSRHWGKTEKGRAAKKRYLTTHPDRRRETIRKYDVSEKGKACHKRYEQTEKGKIVRRRQVAKYQATEKGQRTKVRARKKYLTSEKGKATARMYRRGPGREASRRYRERYPERIKARGAIATALKYNHIEKTRHCEICGSSAKLHAHHHAGWDEEHKSDVWWLCNKCDPPITSILPHDGSLTLEQARKLLIPTSEG